MARKTFSDDQERTILQLRSQGLSYPRIAMEVGLPVTTIEGLIQRRGLTRKERPIPADVLQHLYVDQGMSILKVAAELNLPKTNIEYWLKAHGILRRSLQRYPRYPFSGDSNEKAYLSGLGFGDLHTVRSGGGILVTTTTTHPAMLVLFLSTFEKYGHVSFSPAFNRKNRTYQWSARVRLDSTFSFMLGKLKRVPRWIAKDETSLLWFVAGLVDAEGTVGIVFYTANGRYRIMRPYLSVSNSSLSLLKDLALLMRAYFARLARGQRAGTRTSRQGTVRKNDQWILWISRREVLEDLLRALPLRHLEKVAKSALVLDAIRGRDWGQVNAAYLSLKNEIRMEVSRLESLASFRLSETE